MNITDIAAKRHTAKAYGDRKISDADVAKIKDLLRLSASSVNGQPWHFILTGSDAGKARVAKSAEAFPFNIPNITGASHVVVFASRITMDEDYLLRLLQQEEADGRFAADPALKDRQHGARSMFANIHKDQLNDEAEWHARQTYLNLGAFLLGVAALGLDATPMEGVDVSVLDAEFGLRDKGYQALVVVTLGCGSQEDFNANLPKSRLPLAEIITEL